MLWDTTWRVTPSLASHYVTDMKSGKAYQSRIADELRRQGVEIEMTVDETAVYLNVTPRLIYDLVTTEQIPVRKIKFPARKVLKTHARSSFSEAQPEDGDALRPSPRESRSGGDHRFGHLSLALMRLPKTAPPKGLIRRCL